MYNLQIMKIVLQLLNINRHFPTGRIADPDKLNNRYSNGQQKVSCNSNYYYEVT